MDYKVVVTRDAEEDLERFIKYLIIEKESRQAAWKVKTMTAFFAAKMKKRGRWRGTECITYVFYRLSCNEISVTIKKRGGCILWEKQQHTICDERIIVTDALYTASDIDTRLKGEI